MVESLEWGFDDLRWNGATLTLAWGQERLRMDVEVDAGITPMAEFVFDEQGRAISFEVRNRDDELVMTGERVGG